MCEAEDLERPTPIKERRSLLERRWVNPYVKRLASFEGYIIGSERAFLTDDDRARLGRAVRAADRVLIEYGSGSGRHLVEQAARDPQSLWIGVELRFKRVVRTAEKAQQRGLDNVVVLRTDARDVPALVGERAVDGVFINFPDPWDKRRWKKHRLLGEDALKEIHRMLRVGGVLSFKSDHPEYFETVVALVQDSGLFEVVAVTRDLMKSGHAAQNVSTEFEQLFLSQGLPIHYLLARVRNSF